MTTKLKTKTPNGMKLQRETLRVLRADELQGVAGASALCIGPIGSASVTTGTSVTSGSYYNYYYLKY
jgi:hypothetical protein